MGKETRKTVFKTLKGVGNLGYVRIKNVPMTRDPELGNLIDAKAIEHAEKLTAHTVILKNLPIRGQEVKFFRGLFALSQRDFAEKLGLSHVAIFKWEKAKDKRLDLVNEVAVKALVVGILGLRISASLETLFSSTKVPKRLVLDYSAAPKARRKLAA